MENLLKAAEKLHVMSVMNPDSSDLSQQAMKASVRIERWVRRIAGRAGAKPMEKRVPDEIRYSEFAGGLPGEHVKTFREEFAKTHGKKG